jgi:hypothetical protein
MLESVCRQRLGWGRYDELGHSLPSRPLPDRGAQSGVTLSVLNEFAHAESFTPVRAEIEAAYGAVMRLKTDLVFRQA